MVTKPKLRHQLMHRSIQSDPNRHRFQNKAALILTLVTFVLLLSLSLLYGDDSPRESSLRETDRFLEDEEDDYSRFSCRYIFEKVPDSGYAQCQYAKTCNGGEGVWSSFVFCSNFLSVNAYLIILSPIIVIWMVLLFRLLGSTAEDYFSPSLEMFSVKLGLPPRFAGVSLLALGNGAADVSATISAITSDEENGYKLSLGALTGAAMFVGGVIAGVVIIVAEGVPCRGALFRDVTALLVTTAVVWTHLSNGEIGPGAYALFLSMYGLFVAIVLVADLYHRAVVVPRQLAAANSQSSDDQEATMPRQTGVSRFMTAMSNYDILSPLNVTNPFDFPEDTGDGLHIATAPSTDASVIVQDTPVNLLGRHGILHGDGRAMSNDSADLDGNGAYMLVEDQMDQFCSGGGGGAADISASSWSQAFNDGQEELISHFNQVWEDIAYNGDLKLWEKFILFCELPFTVGRKITVPIPCDGYYNRALIALSVIISPFWFAYYLTTHDINLLARDSIIYFFALWTLVLFVGASILRYAPGGDGYMAMAVATPIAFYGFVIAATWIDFIADHLVGVLDFVGIVFRIPGSIMGLTVLAWGNSMADLSANVAMARKGLANMAMTACFAGPVFNTLVGLGLGFSTLAAQTDKPYIAVELSTPIKTGFIFITVNCAAILFTGIVIGKSRIQRGYGYFAVGLYAIYIITSISLQFSKYGNQ